MEIDYDRIREVTKIDLRLGPRAWDTPSIELSLTYERKLDIEPTEHQPQGNLKPRYQTYICTINPKNNDELASLDRILNQLLERQLITKQQFELAGHNVQNLRAYGVECKTRIFKHT